MATLTANDLKTRGIAAIEESLANQTEATVSVRGQPRYVVMEVAQYHYLRECELDAALAQSQADMAAGRFVVESAQQHLARVDALATQEGTPTKPAVRANAKAAGQAPAAKARRPAVRR
ncbi:MAG TPA: hypothetical protein VLJ57_03320 [Burkholderiaceae bacterium]|nr:hypothetical protein [Burkholderiaceae bacterium]